MHVRRLISYFIQHHRLKIKTQNPHIKNWVNFLSIPHLKTIVSITKLPTPVRYLMSCEIKITKQYVSVLINNSSMHHIVRIGYNIDLCNENLWIIKLNDGMFSINIIRMLQKRVLEASKINVFVPGVAWELLLEFY